MKSPVFQHLRRNTYLYSSFMLQFPAGYVYWSVPYRSKRYPIGQWFTNAFPASWQVSISLHKIYMHMICDVQYTYDILWFSPFLGYTHRSSFHQTSWMSRFFPRFPINTFPFLPQSSTNLPWKSGRSLISSNGRHVTSALTEFRWWSSQSSHWLPVVAG